jgi:hypothetical protein
MSVEAKHVVSATIAACVLAVTAIGLVSFDTFQASRELSISTVQQSNESDISPTQQSSTELGVLEEQISLAEELLRVSEGKILDNSSRENLEYHIVLAKLFHQHKQGQLDKQSVSATVLDASQSKSSIWPGFSSQIPEVAINTTTFAHSTMFIEASNLPDAMSLVEDAQKAWITAQQKIIIEPSTIQARNNVPPAWAPAAPAFNVEAYVSALAPNSYIVWIDGLCGGYSVCGRNVIAGDSSTPVRIELDGLLRNSYAQAQGLSVLVHEAAHARQWWNYGSQIYEISSQQSGLVGTAAVEYMADCATIVKLGYSTGTYTRSCTPDQLSAISRIW